jgi:UDP-N-acetylglucosamine acyltransferase
MQKTAIHKTAVIADGASIAEDAEIGPYAVIGEKVTIGSRTKIGAHAIIDGITTIGEDCQIFPSSSIGLAPQSISYKDEASGVKIGNRVTVREFATIHRGSQDGVFTIIGDDCYLMNYAHVAHDCELGKSIIMANSATLAGHVVVGDFTVMAGHCVFHQFVRIGRFCMVSGMSGSRMDVPPFVMIAENPPAVKGINTVGLKRAKFVPDTRTAIKNAYKKLYGSGLNFSQALALLDDEGGQVPEVREIIDFYRASKRGVLGLYSEDEASSST